MKKHKNKANGFLMFMLEYKREHQVDINEAQLKAGLIWEVRQQIHLSQSKCLSCIS